MSVISQPVVQSVNPATANAIFPPDPLLDESPDVPLGPVGPGGSTGPTEGGGAPPGPATRNPVTFSGVGPVATGMGDAVGLGVWLWCGFGVGGNVAGGV